ncbi:hypothetical protein ACWELB_28925 [Streptomyces asiaticus]
MKGAISQVLDATGLRRTRYRGLSKVTLRHACSATAIARTTYGKGAGA